MNLENPEPPRESREGTEGSTKDSRRPEPKDDKPAADRMAEHRLGTDDRPKEREQKPGGEADRAGAKPTSPAENLADHQLDVRARAEARVEQPGGKEDSGPSRWEKARSFADELVNTKHGLNLENFYRDHVFGSGGSDAPKPRPAKENTPDRQSTSVVAEVSVSTSRENNGGSGADKPDKPEGPEGPDRQPERSAERDRSTTEPKESIVDSWDIDPPGAVSVERPDDPIDPIDPDSTRAETATPRDAVDSEGPRDALTDLEEVQDQAGQLVDAAEAVDHPSSGTTERTTEQAAEPPAWQTETSTTTPREVLPVDDRAADHPHPMLNLIVTAIALVAETTRKWGGNR